MLKIIIIIIIISDKRETCCSLSAFLSRDSRKEREKRFECMYILDGNRARSFAGKQRDENENGTGVYSLAAIKTGGSRARATRPPV